MLVKCFVFLSILSLLPAARIPVPEERIIGGHFIPIEYVPWQVSILLNNNLTCGGSILNNSVILTAAHCVNDLKVTQLLVRAGSSHWKKGGQLVRIRKSTIHKKYNNHTEENDIALLFLESPLEFNESVQLIALAQKTPTAGNMTLVTGWGHTLFGSGFSWPILQGVHLTIVNRNKCQHAYSNRKISKNMICASAPGRDSCQEDSGGPLISIKNRQLIGIVSFGDGCASSTVPGVYTNVANFKKWIKNTINSNIKI